MNRGTTLSPFSLKAYYARSSVASKKPVARRLVCSAITTWNRPSRCASMAFMAWESTDAFRAGRLPPEMLARCAQVGELSFPNVEARVFLPFEFWPWMIKVLQTLAFLHCLLFSNSRTRNEEEGRARGGGTRTRRKVARLEIEAGAQSDYRSGLKPGLNGFHYLQVECHPAGRRDGDVVKAFKTLSRVFQSQYAGEPEFLNTVVIISDAKGVVIACGDEAASPNTAADRPFNRIGLLIGEAKAYEKPNPFLIGRAIEEVNRRLAWLFDIEVLPGAKVNGPRAGLFRHNESLTRLKHESSVERGKVLVEQ